MVRASVTVWLSGLREEREGVHLNHQWLEECVL